MTEEKPPVRICTHCPNVTGKSGKASIGRRSDFEEHIQRKGCNFALLVLGEEDVPSPQILSMVKNFLTSKEQM